MIKRRRKTHLMAGWPLLNFLFSIIIIFFFDSLLNEREKFYIEADMHLQIGDESPEEVAKRIMFALPTILSAPEDPISPQTTAS